jgi:hypothetical protein
VTFKTVFDVAQEGYSTSWFPAFGLIFVIVGALQIFAPNLMRRISSKRYRGSFGIFFNWAFFLFALMWTGGTFASTYWQYREATAALRDGNYAIVEGPVTNFVPMPYTGHAMESFLVQGHRFSYSDYVVTIGFHNTASHGGPIRGGLYVRVTYAEDYILRLEVAD